MSWVAHFLDTNNLVQLNQDVLTKVERRYGQYPFTVMWSSLPYSAYHFSDNVKHILKYPRPTFPCEWSPGKLDYIAWKMIKSCGLITVKWVLNWMSPNISSPPYFMDSLLFCKQNQNCKYFRYSWRPNYINNSCHWEFHKTTLSTVLDTCMNLVLNVNCFQSSTSGTLTFWWAES